MTMRSTAWVSLMMLGACQIIPADKEARPPNIVLIISDDQAWGDFGFMGHPHIRTPNLDRLANRSAVFPRGYVPSSLCRPSLATMITGLYPHQHGITGNDPPQGVPRERMLKHIEAVTTLPKLLAERGYRSLQTGKWWEGDCQCADFTDGMTHGDRARGGRHGDEGLKIGRKTMQPIYDFVTGCDDQPFFLWYAPFLPHMPHNPPERLLARYLDAGISVHMSRYYAMCEWFDETCGQLLDHLDERGLADDTLVLFAVDNGWIQRADRRGYAPRSKRSPYDGGVRTPVMVSWPGHIVPGERSQLVSTIDLMPTALRASGAHVPDQLPGMDLIAAAGTGTHHRQAVFGEIYSHDVADIDSPSQSLLFRWLIAGRWKLIVPTAEHAATELFDIVADPHEKHSLVTSQPRRVESLRRQLDLWWTPK